MEIDQLLFQKVFNFFKKQKKKTGVNQFEVTLDTLSPKLTILARALTGHPINIFDSEREGGWQGNSYFLPKSISFYKEEKLNVKFYLYRLLYLTVQQKLNLNFPENYSYEIQEAQTEAEKYSKNILDELFKEYPVMQNDYKILLQHFPVEIDKKTGENKKDLTWFYGRFMKNIVEDDKDKLKNVNHNANKNSSVNPKTIIEAKKADDLEIVTVDKKAQEDYVLTHNFEKIETVDEYDNIARSFDGDDSLQEDLEALQEYNLKHMVRTDEQVHSVYQADYVSNATIAESADLENNNFHLLYDEWDYKSATYKKDYCKVFPKKETKISYNYYKNTIEQNSSLLIRLKKNFAILNNKWQQTRRQVSGNHIDIDAATNFFIDVKTKHTPDEKVYLASRKTSKELALLFLLDLSLSSDAYANGNRILDVEKQISILFGEVLNEYMIDFQIDGFYSKTRNNTTYVTLKSFNESWKDARKKIGAVEAIGYTRIGPAIRHATYLLSKNHHRKKWLILLSDGKPNDYDKYEGKYGVEDIKQSLKEMKVLGINNFAFAIEEQAKFYLPQMFGNNHYNILTSPVELLNSLTKLYDRIEHG